MYNVHVATDLIQAVSTSYKDTEAHILKNVYDVKSWLEPCLNSLFNHSRPHVFRFRRGLSGSTEMHYKHWSDSPWEPAGTGISLLKVRTNYILLVTYKHSPMQTIPTGTPNLVIPSLEKLDFTKLTNHAKQYRQKCGISEEAQTWWNNFLPELKDTCTNYLTQQLPEWPVPEITNAVIHAERLQPPLGAEIPKHISDLSARETGPLPRVQKYILHTLHTH